MDFKAFQVTPGGFKVVQESFKKVYRCFSRVSRRTEVFPGISAGLREF